MSPAAALGESKDGDIGHGHVAGRMMDPVESLVSGSSHYIGVSQDGDVEKDGGQSRLQQCEGCDDEDETSGRKEEYISEHVESCLYEQLPEAGMDAEALCKARQKLELLHWGQRCQRKRGVLRIKEQSNSGQSRKLMKPSSRPQVKLKGLFSPPALPASEKDEDFISRPTDGSGASTSGEGEEGLPPQEPEPNEAWQYQENVKAGYAPERFLRGKGSGASAPDVKAVLLTLDRGEMMEDFKAIGVKLLQKPKIRRSKIATRNLQMLGLCLRLGKPSLNADMLLREYAPRLPKKAKDKRGRGLRAMTSDDEDSS